MVFGRRIKVASTSPALRWSVASQHALLALVAGALCACGRTPPPGATRGPMTSASHVTGNVEVPPAGAMAARDDGEAAWEDVATAAREGDEAALTPESEGATPALTTLHLPWAAGETWYLTSGPHSTKRAALDFAPPNLDPSTGKPYANACSRKRGDAYWVRAAADGRFTAVLRDGCPSVQIQHADGTTTNYFHLRRSSVKRLGYKVGDAVRAGQILGHPSCEVGPRICGATQPATGVHVHFQRRNAATADRLPADGLVISGWTVKAVGREREGMMMKGEEVRQTRGKLLARACSPANEECAGSRNDLESDNRPAEALTSSPVFALDGGRHR